MMDGDAVSVTFTLYESCGKFVNSQSNGACGGTKETLELKWCGLVSTVEDIIAGRLIIIHSVGNYTDSHHLSPSLSLLWQFVI